MDLTGRKVLITGGSGEIGISIARHFSEHNADVAITYCHNMEAAERLKSETDQNKGLVSIHSLDLTALDGLTDTIEEINCTTGPFDTFIHCSTGPLAQKDFLEFKWEEIQKDIDIVVKGFYALVRTLVPSMIENKRGNIISILTTDVLGSPQGKNIGYLTAKYGLMGLSKGLAKECGIHNIRVNMISPGLTDTKLVNYLPKRQKDVVAHQTPLKRIAQPDDIAKTALFLASDMSSHLSGVNIPVCGGNAML